MRPSYANIVLPPFKVVAGRECFQSCVSVCSRGGVPLNHWAWCIRLRHTGNHPLCTGFRPRPPIQGTSPLPIYGPSCAGNLNLFITVWERLVSTLQECFLVLYLCRLDRPYHVSRFPCSLIRETSTLITPQMHFATLQNIPFEKIYKTIMTFSWMHYDFWTQRPFVVC